MTPQDKQAFGEGGNCTIIPGSGSVDLGALGLRAVALQCIGETTFTLLTDQFERISITGDPAEDETYADGFTLYGSFTVVHVAGGGVRATLASDRK